MKVLLCAIGKEENQYIREWVEYYKWLGFDGIWLYDNNDPDGERFETVIGDYIDNGFVKIIDYRGRKVCQLDAYNECYSSVAEEYDWVAFFDCDEFLTLEKKKNIHHELSLSKFKGFQAIHVNWKNYGDCENLYNDRRPILQRFTSPIKPLDFKKVYQFPENNHVKSIVRTGINSIVFTTTNYSHTPEGLHNVCDTTGKKVENTIWCPYDFSEMYLKHFSTRSTEEYIKKVKRGFPDTLASGLTYNQYMTDIYFKINTPTPEKIQMFEKELGVKYTPKREDAKIFMLCYSPRPYGFVDNSLVTPIQCGAAINSADVCKLKDNQGDDNVSAMNRFYVENSGTYWIWKNVKAKYIGQMQYGRRLSLDEHTNFDVIFKDHDAIVAKPYHYETPDNVEEVVPGGAGWIPAGTVEDGYAYSHCKKDLSLLEAIIKKGFPDYAEDYDKYIKNGKDLIYSAGFVLPYDLFNQYCTFLFVCLKSWLYNAKISAPEDLYIHVMRNLYNGGYIRQDMQNPDAVSNQSINWQTSIGGFLGERLLTLFIYHNCKNIYYVDYDKMEDKPL